MPDAGPTQATQRQVGTSLVAGLGWNVVALVVLALAGLTLNIVIGRLYGPEALGTFNLAFAIFIFMSQFAVFGLHLSALHSVAVVHELDRPLFTNVVLSGAAACGVIATLVTFAGIALAPVCKLIFPSAPDLSRAWLYAAPGLLPFALNKYLLGVVNAMAPMRAFAVFQALRFLLIVLVLVVLASAGVPSPLLTLALSVSEFLLLPMIVIYVSRSIGELPRLVSVMAGARRHLAFGVRAFPAGLVAELNTRIDLLMIGYYLGDKAAGIYTVAALIYEVALQAVVVLRNNLNPRIARALATGNSQILLIESRWVALGMGTAMVVGCVIAYVGFPMIAEVIFSGKNFEGAREPLFWLLLTLPLSAAPLCYSLILSQAGEPGWQSVAMILSLFFNIALNALLIPFLGIVGAAVAMGSTGIFMGFFCVFLAKRILGIRLFF